MSFSINYADIKSQASALEMIPFELYKELITVYKTPQEVYVSSANSSYNFAYGQDSPGLDISYVTQSGQIYATINFADSEDENQFRFAGVGANQVHNQSSLQKVSICIGTGDFHYFQNCEKIIIDNRNFRVLSDFQNRGMFTRSQVLLWAQPIE